MDQLSDSGVRSQNAVLAFFTSKQILPFGFAEQFSSAEQTGHVDPILCQRHGR